MDPAMAGARELRNGLHLAFTAACSGALAQALSRARSIADEPSAPKASSAGGVAVNKASCTRWFRAPYLGVITPSSSGWQRESAVPQPDPTGCYVRRLVLRESPRACHHSSFPSTTLCICCGSLYVSPVYWRFSDRLKHLAMASLGKSLTCQPDAPPVEAPNRDQLLGTPDTSSMPNGRQRASVSLNYDRPRQRLLRFRRGLIEKCVPISDVDHWLQRCRGFLDVMSSTTTSSSISEPDLSPEWPLQQPDCHTEDDGASTCIETSFKIQSLLQRRLGANALGRICKQLDMSPGEDRLGDQTKIQNRIETHDPGTSISETVGSSSAPAIIPVQIKITDAEPDLVQFGTNSTLVESPRCDQFIVSTSLGRHVLLKSSYLGSGSGDDDFGHDMEDLIARRNMRHRLLRARHPDTEPTGDSQKKDTRAMEIDTGSGLKPESGDWASRSDSGYGPSSRSGPSSRRPSCTLPAPMDIDMDAQYLLLAVGSSSHPPSTVRVDAQAPIASSAQAGFEPQDIPFHLATMQDDRTTVSSRSLDESCLSPDMTRTLKETDTTISYDESQSMAEIEGISRSPSPVQLSWLEIQAAMIRHQWALADDISTSRVSSICSDVESSGPDDPVDAGTPPSSGDQRTAPAQQSSGLGNANHNNARSAPGNVRKRVYDRGDGPGKDDDDPAGSESRSATSSGRQRGLLRFACPFQKEDPFGESHCFKPTGKYPKGGCGDLSHVKSVIHSVSTIYNRLTMRQEPPCPRPRLRSAMQKLLENLLYYRGGQSAS